MTPNLFNLSSNIHVHVLHHITCTRGVRIVGRIGVVNAEVAVEPLHLVGDEFAWDQPLELTGTVSWLSIISGP